LIVNNSSNTTTCHNHKKADTIIINQIVELNIIRETYTTITAAAIPPPFGGIEGEGSSVPEGQFIATSM
jgi:hypothetical protein